LHSWRTILRPLPPSVYTLIENVVQVVQVDIRQQRGEGVEHVKQPFDLLPEFTHLRGQM